MRTLRTLETRTLGYTIERIDETDHLGSICASWYEVLCPYEGKILGSCESRAEAERLVIRRELDQARRALALNRNDLAA